MTASKAQAPAYAGNSSEIHLEAQNALEPSSVSGSFQPYTDDADFGGEDNPPAYTEYDESRPPVDGSRDDSINERIRSDEYDIPGARVLTSYREGKTYTISLAPYLSSNAEVLYKFFKLQAELPPQVFVSVKGTHTVSTKNRDKQSSTQTIIDFDFLIDGSDSVLPPVRCIDGVYKVMKVIQDNDGVSAYRGSRFRSTNRNWCKKKRIATALEGGQINIGPTLEEWCQRFCSDKSSVKSFTLHRDVVNWNFNLIRRQVISIIRSTNYCGTITVSPFIQQSRVTIYSPSLINRLRTSSFVWWTCVILQLWIITWPLLILLEKRYEIVRVEHHVSRGGVYSSPGGSENDWVQTYTPAIKAAALGRRQGEVVTTADIPRARDMFMNRLDSESERERRQRIDRGEGTWADSVVDLVRGLSEAAHRWNVNQSWGSDEY
ncbi:uncharacterized protein CIMG_01074 [Coccidioides immitis RS]|uniref:Uncharacterized protein n=3 Tax=Coccidioides immitis TaxID=5501 RepID=J3KID4_COCIM|nr:uncharacterized protein CIMG_01074 [Coccidioides immitis RS]EAS35720.3 hypothetical protein CIMG_01074 [Coccidioides immitis RS]KMP00999.1 hypothetical protein CIRG_01139 [Coccidioides immitis RMSCC 2394]